MIAFEKCAEANEAGSNEWHAGKHLETCAQLAKDIGTPADVVAYAERSCAAYCTAGRSQTGAEALSRCAKLIDEKDGDAAAQLYLRACEMLEDEDKHVYVADHYRAAGSVYMRMEKYSEAAEVMMRFGAACDTAGQRQSQCKAYLSAVVALLFAGNGVDAQATYADCGDVANFQGSEEQKTAYALLTGKRVLP